MGDAPGLEKGHVRQESQDADARGAFVTKKRMRPNAVSRAPDQGVIDFSLGFISSTTSSSSATVVATL